MWCVYNIISLSYYYESSSFHHTTHRQRRNVCLSPPSFLLLLSIFASIVPRKNLLLPIHIHTSILPSLTTHQSFTTKKNLFLFFQFHTQRERERERCHHHHHHLLIISKRSVNRFRMGRACLSSPTTRK